ncbi:hypothetical protein [Chamaesiphon sp. VAR_48_metabat_403]|uniref:hypothetical protein n=1 Tax=Chamaesiphon sp. VAR_48_metabat_403 TaxID=2964700 RepID=UPI00286E0DD3|nr:hypothetical protein [Chamaesiphon sp. VAR_48_metabat_403]
MNFKITHTIAISISIGRLFTPAVRANEDLQLPKATTVIQTDIDGNGIPDWIVAAVCL